MRCERFEEVVVVACLFGDVGGVAEVKDWFGHEDAHHGEGSHGDVRHRAEKRVQQHWEEAGVDADHGGTPASSP